jgi:ATP-dependent DNA helicase RecG
MQYDSLLSDNFRLIASQKQALNRLGVETIEDLLYHFPTRYGDTSETRNISSLVKGDSAVIFGKITKLKTSKGFKSKIPMADAWVEDESGKIHCVWFNQPYLAKMTPEGALVRIEGKVSERKKNQELYFSNPKIEIINKIPTGVGESLFGSEGISHSLYPIYPESKGITSNWIYHKIVEIFKSGILDNVEDPIPKEILEKYNLPTLKTAFIWIHTPMRNEDAYSARKRFAFQEVFFIQLEKQVQRKNYEMNPSFPMDPNLEHLEVFIKRFPFEATDAQKNSITTITNDFKKGYAMSRLLEGDVGSGKTWHNPF